VQVGRPTRLESTPSGTTGATAAITVEVPREAVLVGMNQHARRACPAR
jgi:hypothetical protein